MCLLFWYVNAICPMCMITVDGSVEIGCVIPIEPVGITIQNCFENEV